MQAFEFPHVMEVVAMAPPMIDSLGCRCSWLLLLSAAVTVAVVGTIRGVGLIWWGKHHAQLHVKVESVASSDQEDRNPNAILHQKSKIVRRIAAASKEKQAKTSDDQDIAGVCCSYMDEERKEGYGKLLQILPPLATVSDQNFSGKVPDTAIAGSFKHVVRLWEPSKDSSLKKFHPMKRKISPSDISWEENKLLLGTPKGCCLSLCDPPPGNSISSSDFQKQSMEALTFSAEGCLICGSLAMDQSVASLCLYDPRILPQPCGFVINSKLDLHGVQLHGHECHVCSSTSSFSEYDLRMMGAKPIKALMIQNPKRKLGSVINTLRGKDLLQVGEIKLQGIHEEVSQFSGIFV